MKHYFVLLGIILTGIQGALGAIVLQVDISNPSAVVITATGGESQITSSASTFDDGIYLWDLFSGSTSGLATVASGSLTAGALDTGVYFTSSYKGALGSLNLYSFGQLQLMEFTADNPAFTGSVIVDLSSFATEFRSLGFVGDISDGSGTIGSYVVIPEPSFVAIVAFGFGALLLARKRDKKVL